MQAVPDDQRATDDQQARDDLADLREAFPSYQIGRRVIRGVPCYLARARRAPGQAPAALAAAPSPAVLAAMLAAAQGRPVRLRPAAVVAAYRDRGLTVQQCAQLFGVSRTTITKFLAGQGVALRRAGDGVDQAAVVAAYRDTPNSCAHCCTVSPRSR